MAFKKQIPALDLETTAIENIFLTEVLPMAEGNALKVYLLGYRYACDPEAHARFSHEALGRHLGLTLQEVLDAWQYWEERGLIKKTELNPEQPQVFSVEFISMRQLYVESNFKPRHEAPKRQKSPSPERLTESLREPVLKKMFRDIETLMGRPLEPNDCLEILAWVDALPIEPQGIVKAFEFVVREKNIRNIKYTGTVVRSWCDQNPENPTQPQPRQEKPKNAPAKNTKPNRFHNFEGRLSKLNDSELNALIQNRKTRKTSGGD